MDNRINWEDLRLVLAIITEGTLANAGRHLGISYATAHRRLGQIEARIGVTLFNRTRAGNTPTLAAEELAAVARKVEVQVQEAERRVVGRDLRPSGTVRITTLDTLLVGVFSPIFVAFQEAQQDIALNVVVSNELHSLSNREADVAIRPSNAPSESLVGRKIATLAYAAYGLREHIQGMGEIKDLALLDWLGPGDAMIYPELVAWMEKLKLDTRCRYHTSSLLAMHAAVRDGQGLAVLPCYLGDPDPRLMRVTELIPELAVDLWLLTHKDLRKTARIRVFLDFVAEAVKRHRSQLAGLQMPETAA